MKKYSLRVLFLAVIALTLSISSSDEEGIQRWWDRNIDKERAREYFLPVSAGIVANTGNLGYEWYQSQPQPRFVQQALRQRAFQKYLLGLMALSSIYGSVIKK